MFRAKLLIIWGWSCVNTASGIVLHVSDRPVCRLRRYFVVLFSSEIGLNFETKGESESFSKRLHQPQLCKVEDPNLNVTILKT